jgi:hypothetical protein
MPRGRRLLIGREAAGEIFPAPHLAIALGRASSQLFYSLSLFFVVGRTCQYNFTVDWAFMLWRIARWTHAFYFYATLSVCVLVFSF